MFPYAAVLEAVRKRGKHFLPDEVLAALAHARCRLAADTAPDAFLTKFLDIALDKHDNKYNYISYTALPLLEHVRLDVGSAADLSLLQYMHDVTICSLVGDAIRFELQRLDGAANYMTELLPSSELLKRRLAFALRSIAPALQRLGFEAECEHEPLPVQAARVGQFCACQSLAHSQFILDVSMQPVYVVHDEYLFLRILQTLDATFVSVASLLRNALQLFDDAPVRSAAFIRAGGEILQEGLRHFHTLSTMQPEAFTTFRQFTTGASAIQSVNYKLMESLCRRPDPTRLESLAYSSVPTLQQELRAGGASLDDKLSALKRRSDVNLETALAIEHAMNSFGKIMTRWRHSHYGIAKKFLGEGTGTGYTEGTPYLGMVKNLPVFLSTTTPSTVGPEQ